MRVLKVKPINRSGGFPVTALIVDDTYTHSIFNSVGSSTILFINVHMSVGYTVVEYVCKVD